MHRVTGGTPRLVNIIANKALMLAYGEGSQLVLPRHVKAAAADTPEARRDWSMWLWTVVAVLLSAGLVANWVVLK
jgi:MSHA biogenesis protein MshM